MAFGKKPCPKFLVLAIITITRPKEAPSHGIRRQCLCEALEEHLGSQFSSGRKSRDWTSFSWGSYLPRFYLSYVSARPLSRHLSSWKPSCVVTCRIGSASASPPLPCGTDSLSQDFSGLLKLGLNFSEEYFLLAASSSWVWTCHWRKFSEH